MCSVNGEKRNVRCSKDSHSGIWMTNEVVDDDDNNNINGNSNNNRCSSSSGSRSSDNVNDFMHVTKYPLNWYWHMKKRSTRLRANSQLNSDDGWSFTCTVHRMENQFSVYVWSDSKRAHRRRTFSLKHTPRALYFSVLILLCTSERPIQSREHRIRFTFFSIETEKEEEEKIVFFFWMSSWILNFGYYDASVCRSLKVFILIQNKTKQNPNFVFSLCMWVSVCV